MPLPKPKKGEKKPQFIQRCMADPKVNSEYPNTPQRFAVCNSQWTSKKEEETKKKVMD